MKTSICMVFAMAILGTGCSTMESVRSEEGRGKVKTFEAPYAVVFKAAVEGGKSGLLRLRKVEPGFIYSETDTRGDSWGENVCIWVRERGTNITEVEVLSRQAGPALFFHFNWEDEILETIQAMVDAERISSTP